MLICSWKLNLHPRLQLQLYRVGNSNTKNWDLSTICINANQRVYGLTKSTWGAYYFVNPVGIQFIIISALKLGLVCLRFSLAWNLRITMRHDLFGDIISSMLIFDKAVFSTHLWIILMRDTIHARVFILCVIVANEKGASWGISPLTLQSVIIVLVDISSFPFLWVDKGRSHKIRCSVLSCNTHFVFHRLIIDLTLSLTLTLQICAMIVSVLVSIVMINFEAWCLKIAPDSRLEDRGTWIRHAGQGCDVVSNIASASPKPSRTPSVTIGKQVTQFVE